MPSCGTTTTSEVEVEEEEEASVVNTGQSCAESLFSTSAIGIGETSGIFSSVLLLLPSAAGPFSEDVRFSSVVSLSKRVKGFGMALIAANANAPNTVKINSKTPICICILAKHSPALFGVYLAADSTLLRCELRYLSGVAFILTNAGVTDVATLQAAILHDTVEDTDTTFEELTREFGEEVCGIVREVTDDKSLPKERRKRLQVEHAPTASHKAKLVKLADKLYNLTDLLRVSPEGWSVQRTSEYFEWAREVVFGLRGTNPILEASLDNVFLQKGIKI